MRRTFAWGFLIGCLAVAGCSGTGESGGFFGGNASIAGLVTDLHGNPVRGAIVSADANGHVQTTSTTNGSFVLTGLPAGGIMVHAQANQGGVLYSGQNYIRTFDSERSKGSAITVAPAATEASIHGVVTDINGQLLAGAHVFANAGSLGSSVTLTDDAGSYALAGLISGVSYTVQSNGKGYDSATQQLTLTAGQDPEVDLSLNNASNPTLPAPQSLSAEAWTAPAYPTTSSKTANPYEAIKNMIDRRRRSFVPKFSKRYSLRSHPFIAGGYVEVDLGWAPVQSTSLLGYGIYRGVQGSGSVSAVDVLRDPLAAFYPDLDSSLQIGSTYLYQVTALNTSYPDTSNSESVASNTAAAKPIGLQDVGMVFTGPIRFQWGPTTGATSYAVFVFADYPTINVSSIWDNSANPTTSLSVSYGGPALTAGHTYYYIVLGLAGGGASMSISTIGSFSAP